MSRYICWAVVLAVAVVLATPAVVEAQGVLVVVDPGQQARLPRPIIIWPHHPPRPRPTPPVSYKIKELSVNARLVDQVAEVQVAQTFVNSGSRQLEVSFIFPLPYEGAVHQMTLMVDGEEFPARLLDADEARRLYEEIVRKNRDPALLEWMGAGLFKTSVFPVPPGASRTVSLRYSQICRKQQGLTDFLFPLSTAKYTSHAVEKVSLRATIESHDEIKNIYSPTHAVEITRPDSHHATVTYKVKNEVPTSDFRLFYDVDQRKLSARVLSYRPDGDEDGYLMLLASPKIKRSGDKLPAKTVVFVVDRSGSMTGEKIEQARGAAKFVLNNLRRGDLFNVVVYDSQVEMFRPELQRYDDETRDAALGFIEGIYAGGSTNIDAALGKALGQLQDSSRPSYVLFLTDGLPTAGVTDEMKIVHNAKEANRVRARVFAFGVGYDVNSRLLDKLVRENFGQSEYVRPNEDIEDRVSRFFRQIQSPVMTDVKLRFVFDEARSEEGKPVNRLYPKGTFDLFAGEQLVVVGRYKKHGRAKVVVSGTVDGKPQQFDFAADLVKKSDDQGNAFIERLWAQRRVGEIIDEIDLGGKNDELVKELIALATRHGILTPYTSFLADETVRLQDTTANAARTGRRLVELEETQGAWGFAQRGMKGSLQRSTQAAPSASLPGAMGMGGGMGGGMPADMSGAAAEALEEMQTAGKTVRTIADRTFYRRGDRWIDATVTDKQEAAAQRVKQFSDDYFKLARRHGRAVSPYLVFDEPLVLNVDQETYLIEP